MTNSTHFFIDFAYQIFGNDFPMISSIEMSEKSLMKEENALITATKQCDVSSLGKSWVNTEAQGRYTFAYYIFGCYTFGS